MKRSGPQALALPTTVVTAALWLVVACSAGGPASSSSRSVPAASASPTAIPTAIAPSPTAASPASPTVTMTVPAIPGAEVPIGSLASTGTYVDGWQGSYCWKGTCADMARTPEMEELPALGAQSHDTLRFQIRPTSGLFYDWHVDVVDAAGKLTPLASGAPFDPDAAQATDAPMVQDFTFEAPGSGEWALTISIRFVEGGDAIYAWHLSVS